LAVVSCITISEDVDKTEFVAHPLVPEGMTLGDLKGTADYDMALGMIKSVQETINPGECAEVGNAGLANYGWLSINDFSTPVSMFLIIIASQNILHQVYDVYQLMNELEYLTYYRLLPQVLSKISWPHLPLVEDLGHHLARGRNKV